MKVTMHVEGLKDLDRALTELAEEIGPRRGRTILRQSLQEIAKPIAEAAQAMAPIAAAPYVVHRGGKTKTVNPGGLRRSIKVSGVLSRSQRSGYVKESDVEVFVGPSGSTKAIVGEFGSSAQAPHPYLRPAWDQQKGGALEAFKAGMWARIDKAAKRLAKLRAKG